VIELLYFALLCVVFLFAYGVAVQSLIYPHAEDNWWDVLYRIFYHPYLGMFTDFQSHLEVLEGMQLHAVDALMFLLFCLHGVLYNHSSLTLTSISLLISPC